MFQKDQQYYNFFVNSLKLGRQVLLDNSIFQLGEAFSADKFANWIQKLKPTHYIIPDVFNNCQQTINNIIDWYNTYKKELPGKAIGVLHGETTQELIKCYEEIHEYVDKIALSFNSRAFKHNIGDIEADIRIEVVSENRINFVRNLVKTFKSNLKPIHLLGVSVPQQIAAYSRSSVIQSVDTSNPIVHGMFNIKYNSIYGLDKKVQTKLVDVYNQHITQQMLNDIYYNIKLFKHMTTL